MRPGRGLHLDDPHAAVGGQLQIDARDVATAERHEGRAAHALDGALFVFGELRGALVANVVLPVLFALVVVDGALAGVQKHDFHRPGGRGRRFSPRSPTVNSRPEMYSSTSAG